ncbi:PAS domain S-box protein [Geminocystis sp. CENA526]|uniref:hybrid sensor histidine kinase/response regulator n=1 Tax=Geminocystis sp. CENA526 TaxID=1355871 RepID=UPI003D6F4863
MQDFTEGKTKKIKNHWFNQLLADESPLQKIFDYLPVAIAFSVSPPDSRILYLNCRFTNLFGYTIEDIPNLNDWFSLAYEDSSYRDFCSHKWMRMIDSAKKTIEQIKPQEFEISCKDGSIKNVLIGARVLGNFILSSFVDITPIKQKEQELKQLQEESRQILNHAPIAIASYNLTENPDIIFTNKRFHEIFGYDKEEIPKVSNWFQEAYPDDQYRQEIFSKWENLIAKQRETGKLEYLQCKVTNKQGKVLDILFSAIELENQIIVTCQDLTQIKTVESELEEARESLAKTALAITEAIPVGTYTMVKKPEQPLAYFSFMSERFLELCGLDRQEAESDPLKGFACVHPEDFDAWVALNTEAFVNKQPFYGETRLIVNGEVRWITAESIPRDLPDGSIVWEGVLTNITKTKRYEQELKQAHIEISQMNRMLEEKVQQRTIELETSRAKFQRLLDDISDKFLIFSHTDSILTYVSNSIEKIFGVSADDVIGKSWITQINWLPEYLEKGNIEIRRMIEQKNDSQIEMCFIRPDGELKTINVLQHPVWDQSGKLIAIEGLVEDITQSKQVLTALENSEAKYRTFIETANDLIYSINPEGKFTYLSPNTEDILGFAPEELEGLNFPEVLHPDDVAHCQEFFAIVMGGEKKRGLEYRVIHKDGSWRWHITSASPQFNDQGEVIAFLGFAYDITERKLAELKQQQLNQELIKANRLKDEFLAMMSHELRTPLNAILGMAEILQEKIYGEMNVQQEKSISTIEKSGKHLLSLINDILDVTKIEAGKIDLHLQNVKVNSLCESSLAFINPLAQKKQIQLKMVLPFQAPKIYADENRIRQVLLNLLNNAVKFTPAHGKVTLEVIPPPPINKGDQASNHLRFVVKDTGIGIASEDIEKLFKPFVQIDSALNRQYEGTGLGLVLVKKIVELHGGKVSVTSEVGVGSCFTVDLPISLSQIGEEIKDMGEDREDESLKYSNNHINIKEFTQKKPLILLAEDNSANIKSVKSYLEAKGYHLIIATNGEEAINLMESEKPDLIIMDIQMPKLNGIEAIKSVRSNPLFKDTPIIALTALVREEDKEKCLNAGANEYLSKPVRLRQLWEMIDRFLETR